MKTTAAVLVASMSLFAAVPASASSLDLRRTAGKTPVTSGNTPITGSSGSGSGPANNGTPATGGSTGGSTSGTTSTSGGSTGSTSGSSGVPGSSGSVGGGASGGSMGGSASPITSGNRPGTSTEGNNAPRPGPRSPAEQPGVGGTGPFTEAPPRTMDGTENAGFNFGNILSGINSMTSTIFQMVATFAMLKQLFGMFGKKEKPSDTVKQVAGSADRGNNVARDAATTIDEKLADEAARAEGRGGADRGAADGSDNADDAEASGVARD